MAQYSRTVLTDAGVILARRMMDETITMEFTRIVTGDGQYSSGEDLAARTALKSPKQSFPLSSRSLTDEDRVLHLKYVISNVNPDSSPLTVGYYVREVGIYAHVTGESEILYAVAIADADAADYLPEYDELQPSTITMDWFITVGNTENITIQASPSAYALAEDLEELAEVVDQKLDANGDSKNNTVTFTSSDAADSDVTKSTGWATVNPLVSGETHASFMTKFSTLVKNLRWLYKMLGTKDISSIGDGTVTGGLTSLNDSLAGKIGNDQGGANPVTYIQQTSAGDLAVYGNYGQWTQFQSTGNAANVFATKLDKSNVANNLTTTGSGYALDARQGKALNDALSSKISNTQGGANPVTSIQQSTDGDMIVYGDYGEWTSFQNSNHVLRCAMYKFNYQTVAANTHANISIAQSVMGNIIAAMVVDTPNSAYVFANVLSVTSTGFTVGVYNSASSSITGTLTIAVLYTNS